MAVLIADTGYELYAACETDGDECGSIAFRSGDGARYAIAAGCSSRINEYDLRDHRCGYRFGTIGKLFAKVQESTTKPD